MHVIEHENLAAVLNSLRAQGYSLVGPRLNNGSIVYDHISSADDLPKGWIDEQSAASYSLFHLDDGSYFSYVVGAHSWKKFLYPARLTLFTAAKSGKSFEVVKEEGEPPRYAFIGVRPCEIQAIAVQDKVFAVGQYVDPAYAARRERVFILAVNCAHPGGNCFCASMNTGPRATSGYDLLLTELLDGESRCFLVQTGSERGEKSLEVVPHRAAEQGEIDRGNAVMSKAAASMGKVLESGSIRQLLNDNFEHPQWGDVAKRCLACANCTMVCPTCFCATVEDRTDLEGTTATRVRRWDSCFTSDFTKIAGGNIRLSTRTRYRQWMTHKLANWIDQFGVSGCVGCGRCITWCPVGIDITAEALKIRETNAHVTST